MLAVARLLVDMQEVVVAAAWFLVDLSAAQEAVAAVAAVAAVVKLLVGIPVV